MNIAGIEKLSLLNYPGNLSFVIFTRGCNWNCSYCHNRHILSDEGRKYDLTKILNYIDENRTKFDGVVISGGEPLLQKDIVSVIDLIKSKNLLVKLDTNGSYPEILEFLLKTNRVDYVAIDIKGSEITYPLITNTKVDFNNILYSVDLLKHGSIPYEFRTTIIPEFHTEEDFMRILSIVDGAENYFIQKYRQQEGNFTEPSDELMNKYFHLAETHVKNVVIRG